jgi:teichuronic acid biosynthesis glycosyltransferase TuaC
MKHLKNKTLLVISNGYPNKKGSIDCIFVKSQVDELSKYFKKIVVIVPTPFFPTILKSFIKGYENRIDNQNYNYNNISVYYTNYIKLPNKISYKTFNLFDCVEKVIKKKELHFDLIHAHFTFPSGYVASKIKEKYNKKLIITGHGFDVYDFPFKNKHNEKIFKNVLNSCDFFITVSKKNLKIAKSFQNLNKKSIVIPNGVDSSFKVMSKIKVRKKLKLPIDKKILLHVGSYKINIKNQINLIKAINLLKEKRTDFILYLIGSGPDEQKIKEEVKKLNLNKYIKVIGSKPHSEIPFWMNAADLFLLPSYFEGNPTVMFESLACGTPFIGTNVGGIKEIIFSNKFGFIYNDPEDFNTLYLLINIGLNQNWNTKELFKYSKNFKYNEIIKSMLKIY